MPPPLQGIGQRSKVVILPTSAPQDLPVEAVNIKDDDLGLGRSIYNKEQVEGLFRVQDSLRMRKTCLAELAYGGWAKDRTWILRMGERTKEAIITLIKKKIKLSSYIRKFRMEQLQSHIWLMASSYMGKYLRISSYMRKPFLIYGFATSPL
jgi:hypothetical protein